MSNIWRQEAIIPAPRPTKFPVKALAEGEARAQRREGCGDTQMLVRHFELLEAIEEAPQYYKRYKFISGFSEISVISTQDFQEKLLNHVTISSQSPPSTTTKPAHLLPLSILQCSLRRQSSPSQSRLNAMQESVEPVSHLCLQTLPDGQGSTHLPFTAAAGLLLPSPTPAHGSHPLP